MHASDIAKLAAEITAGSITYSAATRMLGHNGEVSILDSILAGAASGLVGGIIGEVMDDTGVSGLIDDAVGGIGSFFD